jgi:hypothetical protein
VERVFHNELRLQMKEILESNMFIAGKTIILRSVID